MRALVEPAVAQILSRAGQRSIVAVAVLGSAARGEETWHQGDLAGDVDLVAVLGWPDPLAQARLRNATLAAEASLEIGFFPLYSVRRYRTLELFEAKHNAWIVWGDPHVFAHVPVDRAADIPRWEGLRVVLNRAMNCVQARAGLLPTWYAAVKTYLALGEADLVFGGRYAPSYRARNAVLRGQGHVLGSAQLLERVEWATRVKLSGECGPLPELGDMYEHEQWLLTGLAELQERYLGRDVSLDEGLTLVRARLAKQPAFQIMHRALYVLRHAREPGAWRSALREDPIFALWQRALQVLSGDAQLNKSGLRELYLDFEQALQPLI